MRRINRAAIASAVLAITVASLPWAQGAAGAGKLDRSFSRDGIRVHRLGFRDEATDVLVRRDGSIYTTGWLVDSPAQGPYIAAYRPDGRSKASFGSGGRALLDLGDYFLLGASLVRQRDGRFVIVATKGLSSDETLIARFEADGDPDPTFSTDGYDIIDLAPGSDYVEDLVVLPDGDILLVGWTTGPTAFLARYNSNGTIDSGFGTGGYQAIDGTGSEVLYAAVRQGSKILISGRYEDMAAVLRVDSAGVLDGTFGIGGVSKLPTSANLTGIALQRNGKIVAGGGSLLSTTAIATRMSASGVLDPSFGEGGVAEVANLSDQDAGPTLQPRGRVLLAGTSSSPDGERWTVVRLNKKGEPDRSFSGNGRQTTDLPLDLARPFATVTQRDGKALTVGSSGGTGSARYNSTLIRYRGDVWTRALRVRKQRNSVRVSGLQFPALPGQEIVVKLFLRRGGRFELLDAQRAELRRPRDPDTDGFLERPFGARFDRPDRGRCKIVAMSPAAPGYGSSSAKKTFSC